MRPTLSLLTLVLLLLGPTTVASAQKGSSRTTSTEVRRDRDANERHPMRARAVGSRDEDGGRQRGKHKNGPAFCRSGAGHPVHGRAWCRDKGFDGRRADERRWERASWQDVVFGRSRTTRRDRPTRLDERDLNDVLGREVFSRLDELRRRAGADGPLEGRFLPSAAGTWLQVRSGELPIAEFADRDGDRRAEHIRIAR